jgi:uncharacterized membrane protein YqiK
MLPEGKKPLIISIDDVNYYDYMENDGFADRLVVDENGRVATEVKNLNGEYEITYNGDVMPILDKFVDEHPDFSYKGAKGIVAVTGYEGAFGYNFIKEEDEAKKAELKAEATKVEAEREADATKAYADAQLFRESKDAEAKKVAAEKEAEAIKALAEANKIKGENEAFVIKAKGDAEAESIRARALAEAEGLSKKADAMSKYGEAAKMELQLQVAKEFVRALPAIATGVASAYTKVGNITMYGDQSGKIASGVIDHTTQLMDGISKSLGIDVKSAIAGVLTTKLLGGKQDNSK